MVGFLSHCLFGQEGESCKWHKLETSFDVEVETKHRLAAK